MPLTVLDIQRAVAQGVSTVCATCSRFWQGRMEGLPFPTCVTPEPCGGPIAGKDFPMYSGPVQDFERICFVCGCEAYYGIKLPARMRVVGICKSHLGLLDRLQVEAGMLSPIEVHSPRGLLVPANGRLTKRTLAEEIQETERRFEENPHG